MADDGWIKIYRQLTTHWSWQDKPFAKGQAWIDLLIMVNHKPSKVMFDGRPMDVKRGETVTSIRKLSERWGWSRAKVNRFLKCLSDESMVKINSTTKCTTIIIDKYGDFQGRGETKKPLKGQTRATEKPLTDTNKNEKNEKNEKKKTLDLPSALQGQGQTMELDLSKPVDQMTPEEKAAKIAALRK